MPSELRRVLYLEDDPSIAELVMMGLENFGNFEVRHCTTGESAIKVAAEFEPQVCLFDVMLPDMDGPQTLEHIRNTPEGRDVVAIFLTAKAQIHQQNAYLAMGVLGVIGKPFDPVTLGEVITKLWTDRPKTGGLTIML